MKTLKTISRLGLAAVVCVSSCLLQGALTGCKLPTSLDFDLEAVVARGTNPTYVGNPKPSVNLSGQWRGTGYTSISPLVTLSIDIFHNQSTGGISGTYRLSRNSRTTEGKVYGWYPHASVRLLSPDLMTCNDEFSLTRLAIDAGKMNACLSGTDCLGEHKDGRVLLLKM